MRIDPDDLLDLIDIDDIAEYLKHEGFQVNEERKAEPRSSKAIDETFLDGSALAGDLIEVLVDLKRKYDLRLVDKLRQLADGKIVMP